MIDDQLSDDWALLKTPDLTSRITEGESQIFLSGQSLTLDP